MTLPVDRRVLAVVPDLFFATKLAATAKMSGVELELVPVTRAADRVQQAPPALTILDLHAKDAIALITVMKTVAPEVPIVGFYSHVETTLRRDALAAGADAALPRSQFVVKLAGLLSHGLEALAASGPVSGPGPAAS